MRCYCAPCPRPARPCLQPSSYRTTYGTGNTGDDETSVSYPVFEQLREQHDVFSDLIATAPLAIGRVSIRYGSESELGAGEVVSGNFFSGLGVQMVLGRGLTLEDETGHAPVVVLSYDFWTRRFSRDREVMGQTMYVKERIKEDAGVAFYFKQLGEWVTIAAAVRRGSPSERWPPGLRSQATTCICHP